jgi:hypothetical protein
MGRLTRREAIRLTFAATMLPLFQSEPARRGVIFLPGIMGSTLRVKGSSREIELWSKDAWQTYRLLATAPNKLRFIGEPAESPEIFDQALLGPWPICDYYSKLIRLLNSSISFGVGKQVCLIPYDWRRSIVTTAGDCQRSLLGHFGGQQVSDLFTSASSIDQIDVVAHSMGGLIALLLLSTPGFPQERVRSLILIAPPVIGSPRAFRNLFDTVSLPFLDDIVFRWFGKNGGIAVDRLHDVFATFESLYELMPPRDVLYINSGLSNSWSNPLSEHSRMRGDMCEKAVATHQLLAKSVSQLAIPKKRIHLFTGIGVETDNRYHVKQTPSILLHASPYAMTLKPEVTSGDGTVSLDSATWHDQLIDRVNHYPIVGGKHSNLCDNREVLEIVEQILS